jgi:hypothetical protein
MTPDAGIIVNAIAGLRLVDSRHEMELHDRIATVLAGAGIACRREAVLGPEKVGEVSAPAVIEQITRYAASPSIQELLLVTEQGCRDLPRALNGKPVYQVALRYAWGVSL